MENNTREIVVLGGGITGLTTAYYADKYAREAGIPVRITVLEKSNRLGGKIHTYKHEGFTIEKGADSFLARKLPMIELSRELGLESLFVGTGGKGKKAYFLHQGRLHPSPAGMILGIPTDLDAFMETGLLSSEGKARALEDLSLPGNQADEDESLGGFLERRLGPEMVDHVAEPLLAGIYAGDLRKLSLAATFPQFKDAERTYGSVIQGMRENQKIQQKQSGQPEAAKNSAFLSFGSGLSTVINRLEEVLKQSGVSIKMNTGAVQIVRQEDERYLIQLDEGNECLADVVIVTLPTYEYPGLLPQLPGLVKLTELPYVSVANVVLAFNEQDITNKFDGAGFVISRKEGRFITACTWTSSKWEHTAPEDKVLIRCYVGRSGAEEWVKLTDEEIVSKVRQEVLELLAIEAEPIFHEVTRLYRSMPNYPVGHLDHIKRARSELHHEMPAVFITGAAYHGVGVPDCVRQGRVTAEECVTHLKNRREGRDIYGQ